MAAFLPEGKQVLSVDEVGTLHRWDVASGKEVGKIEGSSEVICGLAISADGHRALLGGSGNVLRLVDVDTGAEIRRMPGHTTAIYHVSMSADGKLGLSSSDDKTVRLWNLETGTQLLRFEGHRDTVFGAFFLPGDRHVLSFSRCDAVIIWDRSDGRIVRRQEMPDLADKGSVAVSADGRYFVASQQLGRMVTLHDVATGEQLHSVWAARPVRGLSSSPDGRHFAGGTWRGYAYLWELADADKP
jgi:WD40 repeat protein